MTPPPEGLLLIDKPVGPTSHDIVSWVRRACGQRRIGHSGTLDPAASGLLVLALGRATRLIRFLPSAPKLYEGTILFGRTTDSDDITGETLTDFDGELPSFETICTQSEAFLGRSMQTPPNYSARKVDGQRLYRLARKGQSVEAPAKEIEVSSWEWTANESSDDPNAPLPFKMAVSSGTYVRSLARDLGAKLGCGATLATLRRTEIGPLSVLTAIAPPDKSVREWNPTELVPMASIPLQLPRVELDDDRIADDFRSGRAFQLGISEGGDWIRVDDPAGSLLGVAERTESGWQPRVVIDAR